MLKVLLSPFCNIYLGGIMKVKVWIATNRLHSEQSRIIEIDDGQTEEQISEIAEEIKQDMLFSGYEILDK